MTEMAGKGGMTASAWIDEQRAAWNRAADNPLSPGEAMMMIDELLDFAEAVRDEVLEHSMREARRTGARPSAVVQRACDAMLARSRQFQR